MLKRIYTLEKNGVKEQIEISIFPTIKNTQDDFDTKFDIKHGSVLISNKITGVDELQSLILTLSVIKAWLISKSGEGVLSWDGGESVGIEV